MKRSFFLLACTSMLFGCIVEDRTVPVTTTTVTREVTTTGPGTVPGTREVIVTRTPPAVRVETQTVSPGANYTWTRGYWRWTGSDYAWVPGTWIVRPTASAVWVDGHWLRRSGGWIWIAGHWQS